MSIDGDPRHILGKISRITNPEDSRYEFSLYLRIFIVCNLLQNVVLKSFFSKNDFLWVCWKRSLYVASTRRGKIVYIGISPHPAYTENIWELLLLLYFINFMRVTLVKIFSCVFPLRSLISALLINYSNALPLSPPTVMHCEEGKTAPKRKIYQAVLF